MEGEIVQEIDFINMDKFRKAVKDSGVRQSDLSAILGLDKSWMNHILRDKSKVIRPSYYFRILEVLGMTHRDVHYIEL